MQSCTINKYICWKFSTNIFFDFVSKTGYNYITLANLKFLM